VEGLTDEMEKRNWSKVMEIEALGDPAMLAESGWFMKFFEDAMARHGKEVRDGILKKVGLNCPTAFSPFPYEWVHK
jgi:methylmalonyl-CoA mutase N-terminal domain/subunit